MGTHRCHMRYPSGLIPPIRVSCLAGTNEPGQAKRRRRSPQRKRQDGRLKAQFGKALINLLGRRSMAQSAGADELHEFLGIDEASSLPTRQEITATRKKTRDSTLRSANSNGHVVPHPSIFKARRPTLKETAEPALHRRHGGVAWSPRQLHENA